MARCREAYPNVKVTERVVRGGAARALVDASSGGQLVVMGARGHGGFTGLLLGSVGQALIHPSALPRGDHPSDDLISRDEHGQARRSAGNRSAP